MKAVNNYVIIEKIQEELKNESGLLLSEDDALHFRYNKGIVLGAGDKVTCVKEGDVIYYDKSAGHDAMFDGMVITVIRDRDAVIVCAPDLDSQ